MVRFSKFPLKKEIYEKFKEFLSKQTLFVGQFIFAMREVLNSQI